MSVPDSGLEQLDVGCGTGIPGRLFAKAFPRSNFTGIDFAAYSVDEAKKKARETGVSENTEFLECDAAKLPLRESPSLGFDGIVPAMLCQSF